MSSSIVVAQTLTINDKARQFLEHLENGKLVKVHKGKREEAIKAIALFVQKAEADGGATVVRFGVQTANFLIKKLFEISK